jgi:hypothetical protein
MKRLVVVLAAVAASLAFPATGSTHVHGITPLLGLSCHVDNTITGANRADSTPASAAEGGPIPEMGLIPTHLGSGNGSLTAGEGGFGATTANCP